MTARMVTMATLSDREYLSLPPLPSSPFTVGGARWSVNSHINTWHQLKDQLTLFLDCCLSRGAEVCGNSTTYWHFHFPLLTRQRKENFCQASRAHKFPVIKVSFVFLQSLPPRRAANGFFFMNGKMFYVVDVGPGRLIVFRDHSKNFKKNASKRFSRNTWDHPQLQHHQLKYNRSYDCAMNVEKDNVFTTEPNGIYLSMHFSESAFSLKVHFGKQK